jgi:hypothetical protein
MIGVIANRSEHAVVREFFELFKTPWEFLKRGRRYDVVLCADDVEVDTNAAKLMVFYVGRERRCTQNVTVTLAESRTSSRTLSYKGLPLPIYGDSITFRDGASGILRDGRSGNPALHLHRSVELVSAWLGYDLFNEIHILLTTGQPAENASIPTLETHIAVLRDLIIANGISLIEIPAIPDGYRFIACLTHDIDHPSIRIHMLDRTVIGFLYRALVGSLIDVFRRRRSLRHLLANWMAVLRLPFIHVGYARDFWRDFEHYPKLEKGLRSTFFVIPYSGSPGRSSLGLAPRSRAARYGATEIADQLKRLLSEGCEIGLHGIDAWMETSRGIAEVEQIRRIVGRRDLGVRMHWLYFDANSPARLEMAGADYDSTVGYNQTVGYRAGTTQAYKPLSATKLLELPLHIMDTALFYPCYLDLSFDEAKERAGKIIDNAVKLGGSVVVNWHDRSIAPERLWGDVYVQLVDELESKGAWFATAAEAVSWFRKRRSVVLENNNCDYETLCLECKNAGDGLPDVQLRLHPAEKQNQSAAGSVYLLAQPHAADKV